MFLPPDLQIRRLRPRDVPEVYKMLSTVLKEEEGSELKRQIKYIFLHPALWVFSGVLICVIGISLDIPPIPASIIVLILVFLGSKRRFQVEFWPEVKTSFSIRSDDIKEEAKGRSAAPAPAAEDREQSQLAAGKKIFLVAELRGKVVGTVAVREPPGMDPVARICKLYWLCTHPACRRMGIASKLIKEALDIAIKSGGYLRAAAVANKNNKAATLTLEKVGFDVIEETVIVSSYPLRFSTIDFEMELVPDSDND